MLRTIFIVSVLVFTSCQANPADLAPAKADSLIQASKKDSLFRLIDIRTPQEVATGRIGNATVIDFYAPDFQANIGKLPRDAKILLYCRSSNRTGQALQLMKSMGFKDVQHIVGGINAWRSQGLPLNP
ncbi:MAG TPA: rhodanese-like domain-containing protein [Fibrobacteria bacterium]|nr:rhodanese-like domain-containing protein [Fibrobacteria bacterium]